MKTLATISLSSFVLTNFLCVIDYETVSLLDSWSHSDTRNELFLMTGLLMMLALSISSLRSVALMLYR